jgi:hypothetical protein
MSARRPPPACPHRSAGTFLEGLRPLRAEILPFERFSAWGGLVERLWRAARRGVILAGWVPSGCASARCTGLERVREPDRRRSCSERSLVAHPSAVVEADERRAACWYAVEVAVVAGPSSLARTYRRSAPVVTEICTAEEGTPPVTVSGVRNSCDTLPANAAHGLWTASSAGGWRPPDARPYQLVTSSTVAAVSSVTTRATGRERRCQLPPTTNLPTT